MFKERTNLLMNDNMKRVIDRIKVVADNGDADSQFILAIMYDEIVEYRNKEEAFKYYTLAAENGIAEAQYRLGDIYYYNSDFMFVEKSLEIAFKYYKLAAENGYAAAQYKLGNIYNNGMNKYDYKTGKTSVIVPENMKKALKYYKLAAENGVAAAQIRVLEICLNEKQFDDFEKYYTLASNNEDEHTRISADYLSQKIKTRRKG